MAQKSIYQAKPQSYKFEIGLQQVQLLIPSNSMAAQSSIAWDIDYRNYQKAIALD